MNNMDKYKMLREKENTSRRIRRTNAEIKKSIFDAVYQIVKEKGFTVLSINLISEYSNVSPIIIGKRFKDLDDIIEQFISRWEYWIDIFNDKSGESTREAYQSMLETILDVIWKKKAIQQILAWEIVEESSLLDPIVAEREEKIGKMINRFAPLFEGSEYDVRLITVMLLSSIYFIAGYKKKETFCGMNLKGNIGNLKILEGIIQLTDLVFDKVEKTKEKEIAKKMLESGDNTEKIELITGLSREEIAEL